MSHQTDFEIVSEAPHVDKVLFDNVLSCYDWSKKITATYTLGEALTYTTWDWVGIFRSDWRYLGDYVSYRWALHKPYDCTSPRRRFVAFPAEIRRILPDTKDKFQLIYVSSGNRVTGLSPLFKVGKLEDFDSFNLIRLFRSVSLPRSKAVKRKAENTPGVQDDQSTESVLSINKRNRKVLHVFRDESSFVDFTGTDFQNKLRIVEFSPVVKEYGAVTSTNDDRRIVKLNTIDNTVQAVMPSNSTGFDFNYNPIPALRQKHFDSIEFRNFLSIKPGPQSLLLSLKSTQDGCSNCFIARDLIKDFVEKDNIQTKKIFDLTRKQFYAKPVNEVVVQTDMLTSRDCQIDKRDEEIRELKKRVRELEHQLATRQKDETSDWVVFEPRRIYRMNKLVVKQGMIICELEQNVDDKVKVITNYKEETEALKKMLKNAGERNNYFRSLADELNWKLKCLFSKRMEERQNEWVKIAKKVDDSGTQTSDREVEKAAQSSCSEPKGKKVLKNKQISKILRAEKKQPKSKLHKERQQAEQCPTCGLKFSAKADARVIEEHIVFHDRIENSE